MISAHIAVPRRQARRGYGGPAVGVMTVAVVLVATAIAGLAYFASADDGPAPAQNVPVEPTYGQRTVGMADGSIHATTYLNPINPPADAK